MNDFRIVLIFIPPIRRSSIKKFFEKKANFAQVLDIDTMLCTNLNEKTIQDVIANNTRKTIQDKWNETLDGVFTMMKHDPKKIKIILSHPVYYKINTREFFSVFNSGYFSNVAKKENYPISHTIHIIDDIYDILARLQEPNELFGDAAKAEFFENYVKNFGLQFNDLKNNREAYISWVQHCLSSIISWRSQELLFAQNTAYNFKSNFMLWAIKQDPAVLLNWIKNQDKIFYMSHPISEPRRYHNKNKRWPKLVSQLNQFQSELRKKNVFSVMPTAIDEYRFEKNNDGYTGNLTKRWPLQNEVKKQFKNNKLINKNPNWENILTPKKIEFKTQLEPIQTKKLTTTKPVQKYANAAFNSLEMNVTQAMAHRDHTIVWHTDGIIVMEPYDAENGVLHGGVNKELDYVRGVNDSIEKETKSGNPEFRKLVGIFLKSTIQKILDDQKFFSEYLINLKEIIVRRENIEREIAQYLINNDGNLDLTSTSLGGRIGSSKKLNLSNNFSRYQQDSLEITFIRKCLVMHNNANHIDIIITSSLSQITKPNVINKIQNFLINNKKSNWEADFLSYAKKAPPFKNTSF